MDDATVRAIVAREFPTTNASSVRVRPVFGGCSESACFRVDLLSSPALPSSLFLKVSDKKTIACDREAHGLRAIATTNTIRVPRIYCVGRHGTTAYLMMEYLEISARKTDYAALGTALGRLHACQPIITDTLEGDAVFGLDVDNFLGGTPQKNTPRERDWIAFYKKNRLEFQLDLLRDRGVDTTLLCRVEQVIACVAVFFDTDEKIRPSLLHGDLWQGNWGCTHEGDPVIFDPACYYGHSEAELAMMTLFGDLPHAFYNAYDAEMPRAQRCGDRVPLYQLYHALNHYHLFGVGYQGLCEKLLTELETTIAKVGGPRAREA